MRLKEGIVVDEVKTFGNLKFSGLRREVYERDEEGNSTGVLIKRTYDLKSEAQGRMIQVSLPPEAGAKDFAYDQPVTLVDVVIDSVADARGRNRAEASCCRSCAGWNGAGWIRKRSWSGKAAGQAAGKEGISK